MQLKKPTVLVPMAGLGSRFTSAGYSTIKPLIDIKGKPMIEHVVDSINLDANWIFIVQKLHRETYNLDQILQNLRPGCTVIDTGGGATDGAARSGLLAKDLINNENPLFIINSDNIINWNHQDYEEVIKGNIDGLILCFIDKNPKWSFAKIDQNGFVIEVAEKNPISNYATAGLYIWSKGRDFVSAAEDMIEKNIRTNNEFYICPVYNQNISLGQKIKVSLVNKMHGVGTPEDLDDYIRNNTP